MTGALLLAVGAAVAVQYDAVATTTNAMPAAPLHHAVVDPAVESQLDTAGQADVLVSLRAEPARQAALRAVQQRYGGVRTKDGRKAYPGVAAAGYGRLKHDLASRAGHGITVLQDYDVLPVQYLRVPSTDALQALRDDPAVASISPNVELDTDLAQSLPLVHQPQVAARGHTGAGTSVAVLDTGVDYTRSAFGSCKTAGGSCKVAYTQDIAKDDHKLDADKSHHGTNVSGIVLGMAPDAKVISLDVFDKTASSSDIIAGVDWAVAHQAQYNITAMNLSLGDDTHHTSECTESALTGPFADAATVGIVPVLSAGNDAYVNGKYVTGVAFPACTPGAVRVGAVYDANLGRRSWGKKPSACTDSTTGADTIACFSQGGPLLSMLAPGSEITAAGETLSGTSQAAPHVAGAVAVLAAAYRSATLSQLTYALSTGGPGLIDGREGTIDNPPPGGFRILDRLDLLGADDALHDLVAARRVIGNGVVQLGVNPLGHLNAADGDSSLTGLRYLPTGADALTPGCQCEGWGVADAGTGFSGYADESTGISANLNVIDTSYTATRAVSTVQVGTTLQITHDYHPSATPNLYEATVTIRNVSASLGSPTAVSDLRYRRVMDWDVPPTEFAEYVTLHPGDAAGLAYVSDDGFASADPLAGPSSILAAGDVTDSGPGDHGALFDFILGSLAPGESHTFTLYYGAADTEAGALAALSTVGARAWSLGQPSTPDGPGLGIPNTFIFGYKPGS